MENTNELSIKIQATCSEAIKTLDNLISTMTRVENAFSKILKSSDKNTLTPSIKEVGNELDKVNTKGNKTISIFKNIFTVAGARRLTKSALNWLGASMDYSEALNLFNVILDESTAKATKFQNVMNEAFGTNITETLTRQGLFQSMAENMGIASDYAYIMSETTTKLVNDISSLYNKDENTVAEALRAGIYAGQTKPLRSFGMDITEKTLQPELDRLGIDRTVRDLSQAEKQLLRYISVLRQSQEAQGDWANTIESPSNQLKIFKNQLVETQRALANLFIGTFAKILPYANALLMVIKEVANAIADMFGIEVSDYNTSIASTEDAYVDLGDTVEGATDAIKELKRQTLSFDQINNINENNSSGASGSGVSGGIDQRLLDAIHGYDNGMESVRMKATEIRDRIMEWLGFTKEIDPLTGDVSFKLKDGYSNLKLIGGIIATLAGYKIATVIAKIVVGTKNLFTALKSLKTGAVSLTLVNSKFKNLASTLATLKTKINYPQTISALSKISIGLVGLGVSLNSAYDSFQGIAEEGYNASDSLIQLGISTTGAVASGALLGSTFGPLGTIIGGVAGGVASLVSALVGYIDKTHEVEVLNSIFDGHGTKISALTSYYQEIFDEATKYSGVLNDLKTKYEEAQVSVESATTELENFKTSLELQDGAITNSQLEELNQKYEDLKIAVHQASDASIDYAVALIKSYQDTSSESTKSTASQIANIKALMLAEEGYQIERINAEQKLIEELYNGKITQEEYNQKMYDLKVEYGEISEVGIDAANAIETFNENFKNIDYENPQKLKEQIKGISEEFENTVSVLETEKENITGFWQPMIDDAQSTIDKYDAMIAKGHELSETEQKIYDNAKAQVVSYREEMDRELGVANTTIEEIQSSYKGFISTVYADLVASGADTTKEFSGVIDIIKTDLDELKNVDMSGVGKTMFENMINDIIANRPDAVLKLNKEFNSLGIDGGKAFTQAVTDQIDSQEGLYKEFAGKSAGYTIDGYTGEILSPNSQKRLGEAGKSIGEATDKGTRESLGIRSPSTVYKEIAKYVIEGFAEGIKNYESIALDAVVELLDKLEKKFKETKFNISISNNVESSFNSILTKLETFANKFRSGINSLLSHMTTSMNNVTVGKDNKIYYNAMPYISVPKFEDGGMPLTGQMFIARENGPELVGQIGSKTAVVNNDQIVESVSNGVYNAVASAMSQFSGGQAVVDLNVYTEDGIIVEKAVKGIEQHVAQTGELPFTVPI